MLLGCTWLIMTEGARRKPCRQAVDALALLAVIAALSLWTPLAQLRALVQPAQYVLVPSPVPLLAAAGST